MVEIWGTGHDLGTRNALYDIALYMISRQSIGLVIANKAIEGGFY